MMGVRDIGQSLEQWQMGAKDLRRRMILAPTVQRQLLVPVASIILAGSPPVPDHAAEPLRFDSWGRRIPG